MQADNDLALGRYVDAISHSSVWSSSAIFVEEDDAQTGVDHVDALKIDVEGFEDRVLTGFFRDAPQSLWPRAVVIEHLSRNEWQDDCIADMRARSYAETGRTRSNTMLLRD